MYRFHGSISNLKIICSCCSLVLPLFGNSHFLFYLSTVFCYFLKPMRYPHFEINQLPIIKITLLSKTKYRTSNFFVLFQIQPFSSVKDKFFLIVNESKWYFFSFRQLSLMLSPMKRQYVSFLSFSYLWPYPDKKLKMQQIEAVVQRYSVQKVFLEILQNSQENTCD